LSENEITEYEFDTRVFITSLGDFLQASPNENQYISGQIIRQIKEGARVEESEYLKGEHGYEEITILEVNGLRVAKRIFHPRDLRGVDFAVSKLDEDSIATSVVQVKRNHGKQFFMLEERKGVRELTQLRNLRRWPSSYYLMIDETTDPPINCFVLSSEIASMIYSLTGYYISNRNLTSVKIPNNLVHRYCRGTRIFYKQFYDCRRGSWRKIEEFIESASEYTSETLRALVEILVRAKTS